MGETKAIEPGSILLILVKILPSHSANDDPPLAPGPDPLLFVIIVKLSKGVKEVIECIEFKPPFIFGLVVELPFMVHGMHIPEFTETDGAVELVVNWNVSGAMMPFTPVYPISMSIEVTALEKAYVIVLVEPFVFPDHGACTPGNVNPHTPVNAPRFVNIHVGENVTLKLKESSIVTLCITPEVSVTGMHCAHVE